MSSPTLERSRPLTRDQRSCSEFVIAMILFSIEPCCVCDFAAPVSRRDVTSNGYPTPDIAPPLSENAVVMSAVIKEWKPPRGQRVLDRMVGARISDRM